MMRSKFKTFLILVLFFVYPAIVWSSQSTLDSGQEYGETDALTKSSNHQPRAFPGVIMLLLDDEEEESYPQPGETWTELVTGMEFVWVPEGCYEMGCGDWTDSCYDDEKPVHEVCLDGFWMSRYEVTQGQYTQIMGSNPSYFKPGDNYPVESVSWNDVQGFITALNSQVASTFRLPTEAEWEYAARSGGREEKYAGGDDLVSLGWYEDNSESRTHEVGTKAPNGLGIYDMSGNVWEWVSDWYDENYYSVSPRVNPQGPDTGLTRVARGGSWSDDARSCRASNRSLAVPGLRTNICGFRLAISPGQQ